MTIDIFYIATGVYTEYFPKFLETLPLFFPGVNKRIHIISDLLSEYNGYNSNDISIEVIYQLDLPYPLIPLLKTHFINSYLPSDAEYVFYFDADTIFLPKETKYWDNLLSALSNGEILLANHPGNHYPTYEISEESEAYILPYGTFFFPIISSFFGGKKEKMAVFFDEVNKKVKHDLTTHKNNHQVHYIPPLFDQDYITKLQLEKNGLSFYIKYFVRISWLTNEYDVQEDNFIEQKYDINKKFKKKNMK